MCYVLVISISSTPFNYFSHTLLTKFQNESLRMLTSTFRDYMADMENYLQVKDHARKKNKRLSVISQTQRPSMYDFNVDLGNQNECSICV